MSTVKSTINGNEFNLTRDGVDLTKWSGTIVAPSKSSYGQPQHYYVISLTATNDAGTTTTIDDTDATVGNALKLYVRERNVPVVTILSPSNNARITNSKPTISYHLRDDDSGISINTLSVELDGVPIYGTKTNTPVTGGYDCSFVPDNAFSDGTHTLRIFIQDHDGNAANSSTTFTVDTIAPSLNIINPVDGSTTNNPTLTVSGQTDDTTSKPLTVTIKLNGVDQGLVVISGTNFSKEITLVNGSNTIEIKATDASGLATTVTRTVTLDTSAPRFVNVTVVPNPVDAGATFILTAYVEDI